MCYFRSAISPKMRPDEHKKKRSDQYKKKHGIKKDNDGKGDKGAGRGRASSATATSQSKGSAGKPSTDGTRHGDRRREGAAATSLPGCTSNSSSDDDMYEHNAVPTGEKTSKETTYQRRKIESNWQRYEMPPEINQEEKQAEGTGADYKILLDTTTNAISQFRFREEQDWLNEAVEQQEHTSDYLSFDCNTLADALACVPLHIRLGVKPSAFEKHQIEAFEEDAKVKLEKYHATSTKEKAKDVKMQDINISNLQTDWLDNVIGETPDSPQVPVQDPVRATEQKSESMKSEPDILDEILGSPLAHQTHDSNMEGRILESSPGEGKNQSGTPETTKDLLEGILGLNATENAGSDTTQSQDTELSKHVSEEQITSEHSGRASQIITKEQVSEQMQQEIPEKDRTAGAINIEDELDFLLSLDNAKKDNELPLATNKNIKDEQQKGESSQQPKGGTDNLEDWLDSVLDD